MATERRKSRHDNQQQDEKLDRAQQILQPQAPIQSQPMNQKGVGNTSKPYTSLVPSIDFDIGGVEDIFSENHRVGSCPAEKNDVAGVHSSYQKLWLPVYVLEIVLLSSISRDSRAEFEVCHHASSSNEHADDPDEKRQANGSGEVYDLGWCGEDTGSDHAIENEEDSRYKADFATVIAGCVSFCFYFGLVKIGGVSWTFFT